MRGLVLEGVTASGKTLLLGELQYYLTKFYPSSTKLIISEHYTERILEDEKSSGTLSISTVLYHLDSILKELSRIQTWKSQSKFAENTGNAEIFVIIERFLGGHVANLETTSDWRSDTHFIRQAKELYKRIQLYGLRVIVLRVPPDILPNMVKTTRLHRNKHWSEYLDTIGNDSEVSSYFIKWQQSLLGFYDSISDVCDIEFVNVEPPDMLNNFKLLAKDLLE